ncbi:hypothetical protein RND71_016879 [Anisodus tanguticus]|uniref:Tetratricopeptide repeat protein n=1 Tax=Anisodus tanguticus TaxID=243964 RepID=A0AAE1S971_9SOLA|nr:hypothetical protein RND71_016879 [Anisodus tanguticus]
MAMIANAQENEVAAIDVSIGNIYLFDEAVFSYQKALTVFKSSKGDNHPSLFNESEEALKLLLKAMKLLEDKPGQQSTIAGIEAQMGVMYYMVGRYEEAHSSFENAVAKLWAGGERKSAFFGVVLNQMGLSFVQLFKIDEATELFEEARQILEQEEEKLGTANPDFDDEKKRLVELLKEAGKSRNKKAKSLENLIDPNSKTTKETSRKWSAFGFRS